MTTRLWILWVVQIVIYLGMSLRIPTCLTLGSHCMTRSKHLTSVGFFDTIKKLVFCPDECQEL